MVIDYFLLKEIESYIFSVRNGNIEKPFKIEDEFYLAVKKHKSNEAYVCSIQRNNLLLNFLIEKSIIEDSLVPETIFADLICKQLKKIEEVEDV